MNPRTNVPLIEFCGNSLQSPQVHKVNRVACTVCIPVHSVADRVACCKACKCRCIVPKSIVIKAKTCIVLLSGIGKVCSGNNRRPCIYILFYTICVACKIGSSVCVIVNGVRTASVCCNYTSCAAPAVRSQFIGSCLRIRIFCAKAVVLENFPAVCIGKVARKTAPCLLASPGAVFL